MQAVAKLSTSMARKRGEARAGTFDTIESANAFVNAAIESDKEEFSALRPVLLGFIRFIWKQAVTLVGRLLPQRAMIDCLPEERLGFARRPSRTIQAASAGSESTRLIQ